MLKDLASDVCTFVRLKIWKYINLEITQIFLSRCTKLCFSSLQSLSHVWLFAMPWTTARQASVSITNSWSPPKPMSIQPSHPLSTPSPPVLNLSQHQGLFYASVLPIRWPKYWSFSFNISPSSEHPGLIFFRMDWLDLFAVQGALKSSPTPQLKSINSSALSFLYSPTLTGKTIALTRWTFVGKVISLLFNMLSRLVITFLPRSKCLLISWLQSPSAVILEPRKIKSATVSPSIAMKWWYWIPWS